MKYKNSKCKRLLSRNYKKIIISEQFKSSSPRDKKLQNKIDRYFAKGQLSPIVVNENMELIDGYCTYLIVDALKVPKRRFKIYKVKRKQSNGQANIRKDVSRY